MNKFSQSSSKKQSQLKYGSYNNFDSFQSLKNKSSAKQSFRTALGGISSSHQQKVMKSIPSLKNLQASHKQPAVVDSSRRQSDAISAYHNTSQFMSAASDLFLDCHNHNTEGHVGTLLNINVIEEEFKCDDYVAQSPPVEDLEGTAQFANKRYSENQALLITIPTKRMHHSRAESMGGRSNSTQFYDLQNNNSTQKGDLSRYQKSLIIYHEDSVKRVSSFHNSSDQNEEEKRVERFYSVYEETEIYDSDLDERSEPSLQMRYVLPTLKGVESLNQMQEQYNSTYRGGSTQRSILRGNNRVSLLPLGSTGEEVLCMACYECVQRQSLAMHKSVCKPATHKSEEIVPDLSVEVCTQELAQLNDKIFKLYQQATDDQIKELILQIITCNVGEEDIKRIERKLAMRCRDLMKHKDELVVNKRRDQAQQISIVEPVAGRDQIMTIGFQRLQLLVTAKVTAVEQYSRIVDQDLNTQEDHFLFEHIRRAPIIDAHEGDSAITYAEDISRITHNRSRSQGKFYNLFPERSGDIEHSQADGEKTIPQMRHLVYHDARNNAEDVTTNEGVITQIDDEVRLSQQLMQGLTLLKPNDVLNQETAKHRLSSTPKHAQGASRSYQLLQYPSIEFNHNIITDFGSDKEGTPPRQKKDSRIIDEVTEDNQSYDDDTLSQASMASLSSLSQKFNFLMQQQALSGLITSGSGAIPEQLVETLPPLPQSSAREKVVKFDLKPQIARDREDEELDRHFCTLVIHTAKRLGKREMPSNETIRKMLLICRRVEQLEVDEWEDFIHEQLLADNFNK
ncbi:hypothetical protein FGO68_gene15444 [Halteria grandinella]|uniref:Uncharacterized protein n=1 Tax=Halteria grandinella TaxID=5974 RepID=A0A8J8NZG8_HALGN|nr:hypothetical protein FGO68_gene15444 [Halteria grandinella]